MEEVKETYHIVKGKDAQGHTTVNQYTLLRSLGQGAFGKVKLCEASHGVFAVKLYSKHWLRRRREFVRDPAGNRCVRSALEDVAREVAVMKKLRHVNVLRLHEVIEDSDEGNEEENIHS